TLARPPNCLSRRVHLTGLWPPARNYLAGCINAHTAGQALCGGGDIRLTVTAIVLDCALEARLSWRSAACWRKGENGTGRRCNAFRGELCTRLVKQKAWPALLENFSRADQRRHGALGKACYRITIIWRSH